MVDDLKEDRDFYKRQSEDYNAELSKITFDLKSKAREFDVLKQKYDRIADMTNYSSGRN